MVDKGYQLQVRVLQLKQEVDKVYQQHRVVYKGYQRKQQVDKGYLWRQVVGMESLWWVQGKDYSLEVGKELMYLLGKVVYREHHLLVLKVDKGYQDLQELVGMGLGLGLQQKVDKVQDLGLLQEVDKERDLGLLQKVVYMGQHLEVDRAQD